MLSDFHIHRIWVYYYRFFTGDIFSLILSKGSGIGLEYKDMNICCVARLNALKIINLG